MAYVSLLLIMTEISEYKQPKTNVFQRLCPKESYPSMKTLKQDFAKPDLKQSYSRGQMAATSNTLYQDSNEVKEMQVSIDPKLNQIFINSPEEMAKNLNVNPVRIN